jgi:hypothetical protein
MERAARDITVINAAPVSTSLFDARHNAKYVISLRQRGVDKECKRVKNRDPAAADPFRIRLGNRHGDPPNTSLPGTRPETFI